MGRKTEGTCPLKRFQYHMDNVLGYKFRRHQKQVGKKKYYLYSLQDNLDKSYLNNSIFHDEWLDCHVRRVKDFTEKNGRKGELKTIYIDEHVCGKIQNRKRCVDGSGVTPIAKRAKTILDFEQFACKAPE